MGDLRVTLHDLFGYLLPGLVALASLALALSAFGSGVPELRMGSLGAPHLVTLILVCSYLLGHAVHSLGNALPLFSGAPEQHLLGDGGLPSELILKARTNLEKSLGISTTGLPLSELFALVDEARILRERSGDRAIYIYREGFYRGMAIATACLALGVMCLIVRGPVTVALAEDLILMARRAELVVVLLVSVGCVVGFYYRMQRFGRYRVQRALYQYILSYGESHPTQ